MSSRSHCVYVIKTIFSGLVCRSFTDPVTRNTQWPSQVSSKKFVADKPCTARKLKHVRLPERKTWSSRLFFFLFLSGLQGSDLDRLSSLPPSTAGCERVRPIRTAAMCLHRCPAYPVIDNGTAVTIVRR